MKQQAKGERGTTLGRVHPVTVKRLSGEGDVGPIRELLAGSDMDLADLRQEGAVGLVAHGFDDQRPAGYAQLVQGRDGWTVEFARPEPAVTAELLHAARQVVRGEGGGPIKLWVRHVQPDDDRVAATVGLVKSRDLYQMRRPLPAGQVWELATRPFRPGVDDEAWLRVNNRAFSSHPEQGGWDAATLKGRETEPWFDPQGFLLHESDGRLAGFCWTRIHADHDPPLGEIYVIAVDPDFQGTGLGRSLVLAGLDYLARRGITVGMLYVDADNHPAVNLYRDLGFEIHHVDRAYTGEW
jgi:mycothiol synthase